MKTALPCASLFLRTVQSPVRGTESTPSAHTLFSRREQANSFLIFKQMMKPSDTAKPLLLAPAGNWECAHAAVENGADAIYFGVGHFNARARAGDFTEQELPTLMAFLHKRGVRGYAAFNTLVFTSELPAAEQSLRAIISAGVDAAIVQDVGNFA